MIDLLPKKTKWRDYPEKGDAEMTKQERKLVKKLSEVMQEVKYIQKTGRNTFHKYTYATESDVAEHVREELAKRFVMMIPNVTETTMREHKNRNGNTEYIVKVRMEFKFIDGETGEEISFHTEGEGQDAGDKAVYKAMTGAQKYALLKVFMIPTGDDPEEDASVDERNNIKQAQDQRQQQQEQQQKQKEQQKKREEIQPIKPETIGLLKVLALKISETRNTDIVDSFAIALKNKEFKMASLETWREEDGKKLIATFETWIKKLESAKEGVKA